MALARGPLIYCFEGADNPVPLRELRLRRNAGIDAQALPELSVLALHVQGKDRLTAIAYYAWANRGANEMRVWMKERPRKPQGYDAHGSRDVEYPQGFHIAHIEQTALNRRGMISQIRCRHG